MALRFETPVDKYVRATGKSRRQIARAAQVSPSTLLKARALDIERGRLHWTSLVLIGIEMGIFSYSELVNEDDPRLRKLAPKRLRSSRGRGAPNYKHH